MTWSVWPEIHARTRASRSCVSSGRIQRVDLGRQVGGRGQQAEDDEGDPALPRPELGVHDDGDARRHQSPRLGQRAEGEGEPARHAVHARLPLGRVLGLLRLAHLPPPVQCDDQEHGAQRQFHRQHRGGRGRRGLRWPVLGGGEGGGHDDCERQDPTADEEGRLGDPVLRRQHERECREGNGLERDAQGDDHEVENEHQAARRSFRWIRITGTCRRGCPQDRRAPPRRSRSPAAPGQVSVSRTSRRPRTPTPARPR